MFDTQFGTESPSAYLGRARLTLGMALAAKPDVRSARTELEHAARVLEAAAGAGHPWTAEARMRLAALTQETHRGGHWLCRVVVPVCDLSTAAI